MMGINFMPIKISWNDKGQVRIIKFKEITSELMICIRVVGSSPGSDFYQIQPLYLLTNSPTAQGSRNEMGGCDIQSNYTMCVFLLRWGLEAFYKAAIS